VTLRYLPEHVREVLQSLALARKEAEHLRYSQTTLFASPLDLAWVQALGRQPAVAEKVEAFGSRFARLQDHLGEKLLPRYAALVGEPTRTLLDTLAFAERAEVLSDAEAFIKARRLRNALVHEYMHDAQVFLDSLSAAHAACELFFSTVEQVAAQLERRGISSR
jgi:hypothetical protein